LVVILAVVAGGTVTACAVPGASPENRRCPTVSNTYVLRDARDVRPSSEIPELEEMIANGVRLAL
jgi:hypothetical protein